MGRPGRDGRSPTAARSARTLDRNGLRPARYIVTDDDLVVMASESGVLPIPENKIVKKWRLQPGKMFLIDLEQGRIIDDEELKDQLRQRQAVQAVDRSRAHQARRPRADDRGARRRAATSLLDRQQAFGYTQEDLKFLMAPMAQAGEEGIGSMGNDSPLAVLSDKNKPLYNYFKQLFAQVTNPPIDPIREAIVMSLVSFIGPKPNLLDINDGQPADAPRSAAADPRLRRHGASCATSSAHTGGKFKSYELDITYPLAWGKEGVEAKLASLCAEAVDAIRAGHNILIITRPHDGRASRSRSPRCWRCRRSTSTWCARACAPPPAWSSKPARRARCITSRVLAGYGAEAVHPYLALETLAAHAQGPAGRPVGRQGDLQLRQGDRQGPVEDHVQDGRVDLHVVLRRAALRGDRPRTRRWSTSTSRGTASRRSKASACSRSPRKRSACTARPSATTRCSPSMLDAGGEYAWRVRGEEHMWTPDAIAKLQHSARANNFETYKEYAQLINDQSRRHMTLRGLFEFKVDPAKAIPIDEVEPAKEIVKRFATGAMSLGSISHRGARHAGRRDEPHRRQEQHRRRRRGPGALPQRAQGHPDQEGPHDQRRHRRGRRRGRLSR